MVEQSAARANNNTAVALGIAEIPAVLPASQRKARRVGGGGTGNEEERSGDRADSCTEGTEADHGELLVSRFAKPPIAVWKY